MADAGVFGVDERVQLLEGEVVVMPAIKAPHATSVDLTRAALERLAGPSRHVRTQQPLFLEEKSEPEPDVAVVEGGIRDYEAEHPRTALLVVEVSDTTLSVDRGRKRRIYAAAGIQEYWIVNLQQRRLEVYREPGRSASRADSSAFQRSMILAEGASVEPLFATGQQVPVADLLPRVMR